MRRRKNWGKVVLYILVFILISIPLYLIVSNYITNRPKLQYTFNQNISKNMVKYPDEKFAVISDLHYYDKTLGTTGSAFDTAILSDRKLLKDSEDLLNLAVENILKSDVKFVLVSGDITKDGEMICHQNATKALSKLLDKGIKVFVVPGNHDINNPQSVKYEGDKTIPVENVTPQQFADIYQNFGYGDALYRDKNSLSYVAEISKNLWLVAIDACRYRENVAGGEEIVGGKLSQGEVLWLEDVLNKANQNKKAVIVMEHHGVVEHWKGQRKLHPDYLVEDYKHIGKLLASYSVRLAFTGHYHAQDITLADFKDSGFLYDIETGSLVTSPCPLRYCTIKDNKIDISSQFMVGRLHPETDFKKNADKFVFNAIEREAFKTLKGYFVPNNDAHSIAAYITDAFIAHYRGDENIANRTYFDKGKLSLWGKFIYSQQEYVVNGLWKDLPPSDNNAILDLSTK